MLADGGYDIDDVRASLLLKGILPVIPPKANRKQPIACDFRAYKDRNRVERMVEEALMLPIRMTSASNGWSACSSNSPAVSRRVSRVPPAAAVPAELCHNRAPGPRTLGLRMLPGAEPDLWAVSAAEQASRPGPAVAI